MNMFKIKWCIKQKKGIKLIDSKPHLARSYIKEADEALENMYKLNGKWKVITAYYACYNALYALLMNVGIKSEIHSCTIELMKFFDFDAQSIRFIRQLKKERIKGQYYLEPVKLKNENDVKAFVLMCKTKLNEMTSEKINEIRKKF